MLATNSAKAFTSYMFEKMRKTVLVDMDDVITDLSTRVEERIVEIHPDLKIIRDRERFYFYEVYPEYQDELESIVREPGFYKSLKLVEGALEGWEKIIKLGYEPRICSAPISNNDTCVPEKMIWLENFIEPFFGDGAKLEAIFDKNKYLHDGIALIDDKPIIKNSELANWQRIIFNRSYNQNIDGPRLYGWNDENLGNLLQQAQERYDERNRNLGRIALI